jgi:molybdopterin synthase sulfur carrier subunit
MASLLRDCSTFAFDRTNPLLQAHVEITLLTFAQARETFGFGSRTVPCAQEDTPRAIVSRLVPKAELTHLRVALDCEYVTWDTPIGSARELAIIPPVSGG